MTTASCVLAAKPPCADCGALVSLSSFAPAVLDGLDDDLAVARRKILCGGCIDGGPAVVTVCDAPAPDIAAVLMGIETGVEPERPLARGLSLREACEG